MGRVRTVSDSLPKESGPSRQGEEDLYVAVTRAWCRMLSREERRKRPLGPYVFGCGFVRSVAVVPVDQLLVASVCARLACRYTWPRDVGESLPLERPPSEALDRAAAWWRAFERPDGLGLHYVELGGGTLEFLSVARRNDRPDPGLSGSLCIWRDRWLTSGGSRKGGSH